jgi:hypothetical protein
MIDIKHYKPGRFTSSEYPKEEICVWANNMIKQILEMQGFEHGFDTPTVDEL